MKKLIKKVLACSLALGMCVPTFYVEAATRVQTVMEGSEIALNEGSQVSTLSALLTDEAKLEDWYEVGNLRVTKLQKDVFHIDEATSNAAGGYIDPDTNALNNPSSMYLVFDGNEAILIDGGNSKGTNRQFSDENNKNLRNILDELVYEPGRGFQVIIAHKHGDHIGAFTVDTVIEKGTPMFVHEDDYAGIGSVTKIYEVKTFKQDDVLGTANFKMKVVDVPGHTDGSCGLVNEEREIVFIDDALGSSVVYLNGEIQDLYYGARSLYNMIKDMDNPILYAGHRWQQYTALISANGEMNMGEVGKQYVKEFIALFENVLKGDYKAYKHPLHSGGNVYYSESSDLNHDGKFPGFKGNDSQIANFIAQNSGIHAMNKVEEGSTIALSEGTEVANLTALETAAIEDWYEVGCLRVTKVQEGVLHIDEATTKAKAGYQDATNTALNNPSSMYLILDADEAILIDGGNSSKTNGEFSATLNENLKTILDELVDKKNRELQVIIAHKHGDHIGAFTVDTVIPQGTPMYIHEDDYAGISSVTKIYEVKTFKQGDVLGTTDFRMEVVDVPGHTDGSCALINHEREIIFTDDAVGSGTVWLGDVESLNDFEYGVNNLWDAIKDMNNPILYAGHRWQQYESGVSASGKTIVGEIGKQYIKEYVELMNNVKDGNYIANEEYVSGVGFYSPDADLNKDERMPGFKANKDAVLAFVVDKEAAEALNKRIEALPNTMLGNEKILDTVKELLEIKDIYSEFNEDEKALVVNYAKVEELLNGNSKTLDTENIATTESPLKGKTIGYLGSSITLGMASENVSFVDYIAKMTDSNAVKVAISGGTLALKEGVRENISYITQLNETLSKEEKLDALVVQLSTNDTTFGIEIGELSSSTDIKDLDYSTVIGAIEYIVAYAKEKWDCPVMFYVTPYLSDEAIGRYGERTGADDQAIKDAKFAYQETYEKMIDALYKANEKWDFDIIDMWNNEEFKAVDLDQWEYYMSDIIHPKKSGYLFWYTPYMKAQMEEKLGKQDSDIPTVNPDTPITPDKPGESTTPETGDDTNIVLWTAATVLALGGVITAVKKTKKEED